MTETQEYYDVPMPDKPNATYSQRVKITYGGKGKMSKPKEEWVHPVDYAEIEQKDWDDLQADVAILMEWRKQVEAAKVSMPNWLTTAINEIKGGLIDPMIPYIGESEMARHYRRLLDDVLETLEAAKRQAGYDSHNDAVP